MLLMDLMRGDNELEVRGSLIEIGDEELLILWPRTPSDEYSPL